MRELKDEKLKHKLDILYNNIKKLKKLDIDNYYCANLLDWFNEVVAKNIAIFKSKKGYYDIKLSNKQMDKISNNLSQIAYNNLLENGVDTH